MPLRKPISAFFLHLMICYGVFVALWSWVDATYAHLFRSVAGVVFRDFGPHGFVQFEAVRTTNALFDTEMRFKNVKARARGKQKLGTRYHGYAPTTMLLSLILATPVSWRRRGTAILFGLILIHGWVAWGLWLLLMNGYSSDNIIAMYHFSPFVKTSLSYVTSMVTESTITRYAVPLVFWVLVTFRRDDLEALAVVTNFRAQPAATPSKP